MKKFTLVELLVVIAIIGMLASLLLPALSKARQTAISVTCISKMKQIHIAQTMYTLDNDQVMMKVKASGGYYWWRNIASYLGYDETGTGPYDINLDRFSDQNIFKCPNAELSESLAWQWTRYGYNIFAGDDSESATNTKYDEVTSTNVSDPTNALLLMDTDRWKYQGGSWSEANASKRRLHNNNTNTIFVDGHTRANVSELYQIQLAGDSDYWFLWSNQQGQ